MSLDAALDAARTRIAAAPEGPADDGSLRAGLVEPWLREVDAALGRLFASGLAHPDPELPSALALLADRAAGLGATSALRLLGELAVLTHALTPGPSSLGERAALCAQAFDAQMRLVAHVRLLRADLALAAAALPDASEPREAPPELRYTGRVRLDGMAWVAGRLVLVGRDERGAPIRAIDAPVGGLPDDWFGAPVISRLFQASVSLAELGACALDFDRHPAEREARGWRLGPAFRAVPRRVPLAEPVVGPAIDATLTWDGEPHLTGPDGELPLGDTLRYNLLKRLVIGGPGRLSVVVEPTRAGPRVIAALDGARCFPTVDARAWRVDPAVFAGASDVWLRAAGALFSADAERWTALWRDVSRAPPDGRLAWWLHRTGGDPPAGPVPPGADAEAAWSAFTVALAQGVPRARLPAVPAGDDLYAAAARGLHRALVDADREGAARLLDAHREAAARDVESGRPVPFGGLLALADAIARVDGDRSGPIGDRLALSAVAIRERAARALVRWRVDGEAGEAADAVALAAVSAWGPTLVGRETGR